MKIFNCQQCGQTVLFENTVCRRCGSALGYLPDQGSLSVLVADGDSWRALADGSQRRWRYCANQRHRVCNWLLSSDSADTLCRCCELNRHIPDLNDPSQLWAWQRLEFAKHRLVYSLMRFKLPIASKNQAPNHGLSFDFISQQRPVPAGAQASTGHQQGQVTITTEEADPAEREQQRLEMDEPYRTLIGHFRHEVGHYYWEQLVQRNTTVLNGFRQMFGDDRQDYQQALQAHYQRGAPADWQANYISAYASSHPWEDWAETWAHYFHLIDTLETAYSFGLSLRPGESTGLAMSADFDPYEHHNIDAILDRAVPLTFAVNSLNRSMGQPDLYPFVVSQVVREKLAFIHRLIAAYRQ